MLLLSTQEWRSFGKTCPSTCTLNRPYIGTCIQWRTLRSDRRTDFSSYILKCARQVKKKPSGRRCKSSTSLAVKNTCNASIISKGYCFYKSTNGIKRHLAVDTLGFPFFTNCTKANLSDDAGLVEMLAQNIAYFKSKPVNPREDYNLTRPRLPSWISDRGVRADLPTNHEENQVWTLDKTIVARKRSEREIWICSGCSKMGDWTVKCLDGEMQNPRQELWENFG